MSNKFTEYFKKLWDEISNPLAYEATSESSLPVVDANGVPVTPPSLPAAPKTAEEVLAKPAKRRVKKAPVKVKPYVMPKKVIKVAKKGAVAKKARKA